MGFRPFTVGPGPAPGSPQGAELDRLVHTACTAVWTQLLSPDTSKPQHLLKAALLVPSVLHGLHGSLTFTGRGSHPPTRPTFSYLCSLLQDASKGSDAGVTLPEFEAAVLHVSKEVCQQWLMLAWYHVWTWRLAVALVLLCLVALIWPAAAAITILPGLALGPAVGILVVVNLDENTKLGKQWVRQQSGLPSSSTTDAGSQLQSTLELANQLREVLGQPDDELDELQAGDLYLQVKGDELCQAADLEAEDAQQQQQEEQTIARAPAKVATRPLPRPVAIMNPHQLPHDSSRDFIASKGSILNKTASVNTSGEHRAGWPLDYASHNSSSALMTPTHVSSSMATALDRATFDRLTGPQNVMFQSLDLGPNAFAAGQDRLSGSFLFTADRHSASSASTLKSNTSLLRSLFSKKYRVSEEAKAVKPHKMSRSAQKAVAAAQAQAHEEGQRVLGWKARTSQQSCKTGKVISRPGVPGLYFLENLPPPGSEVPAPVSSSDDDEDDDPRLSFEGRNSHEVSTSLELSNHLPRFNLPKPKPGAAATTGMASRLMMSSSSPAACPGLEQHVAIGSASSVGSGPGVPGQAWRPSMGSTTSSALRSVLSSKARSTGGSGAGEGRLSGDCPTVSSVSGSTAGNKTKIGKAAKRLLKKTAAWFKSKSVPVN